MSEKYSYLKDRLFKFSKQNGECIESTYKARTQSGYALMKFDASTRGAHRISWMVHHGDIPDGLLVLHKCDNPLCIRIDHLFLGTSMDNSIDMRRKGRENYEGHKFHSDSLAKIAIELRKKGFTHKKISEELKLSMGSLNSIFRRKKLKEEVEGFYGIPKYSQETRNQAWDLKKKGVKNKEIIKILGIPKRSLLRILNKFRNIQNS